MALPSVLKHESLGEEGAHELMYDLPKIDPYTFEGGGELFYEMAADLALGEVETKLESRVSRLGSEMSGSHDPRIHGQILEREKAFFTKIFTSAAAMADKHPGKITLLFDMDFTLINRGAAIRPSFPLVVESLDDILGERLEFGLLTTRRLGVVPEEILKDLLIKPLSQTPEVRGKLNRDFVISSGYMEKYDPEVQTFLREDDPIKKVDAVKSVLDPEVVEDIRMGKTGFKELLDPKLFILGKLADSNPDRAFIMIDDFSFVSLVDPDRNNVAGVHVADEVLDKTLNPYS